MVKSSICKGKSLVLGRSPHSVENTVKWPFPIEGVYLWSVSICLLSRLSAFHYLFGWVFLCLFKIIHNTAKKAVFAFLNLKWNTSERDSNAQSEPLLRRKPFLKAQYVTSPHNVARLYFQADKYAFIQAVLHIRRAVQRERSIGQPVLSKLPAIFKFLQSVTWYENGLSGCLVNDSFLYSISV